MNYMTLEILMFNLVIFLMMLLRKSYLTQMCFDNISLCGSNQAVKYYTGGINLKDSPWMKGLNTGSIICQDQQAQN